MDEVTPAEAGAILERHPSYIPRLVARGDLIGRRLGPDTRGGRWLIDAASVYALKQRWDAMPPQRGRPADLRAPSTASAKRRSQKRAHAAEGVPV